MRSQAILVLVGYVLSLTNAFDLKLNLDTDGEGCCDKHGRKYHHPHHNNTNPPPTGTPLTLA